MKLSIIIPVLNEAENLQRLLPYLKKLSTEKDIEIVVIDGGSEDLSEQVAKQNNIPFFASPQKGRSCQMHFGSTQTSGELLYFIHADVLPPHSFYDDIFNAINYGKKAGCFSFKFDEETPLLKFNARMTRFQSGASGGGDQTLFILRNVYNELGGFDTNLCIMEDFELVRRIKIKYDFHIIKKDVIVSARKYKNNSWLKVQLANSYIFLAYKFGASQTYLYNKYRNMLS